MINFNKRYLNFKSFKIYILKISIDFTLINVLNVLIVLHNAI